MARQIANPDLPAPPKGKYPAKAHCRRVAKWLAENGGPKEGVIYLEGQALREHEVGFCCIDECTCDELLTWLLLG